VICNMAYALLAEDFRVRPTVEVRPDEDGWLASLDAAVSGTG
jgi:hypothetical protein